MTVQTEMAQQAAADGLEVAIHIPRPWQGDDLFGGDAALVKHQDAIRQGNGFVHVVG